MRSTVICSCIWAWAEIASRTSNAVILSRRRTRSAGGRSKDPLLLCHGFLHLPPLTYAGGPSTVLRRLRMTALGLRDAPMTSFSIPTVYNPRMRKLVFVTALFLVVSSAFAARFEETFLDKTMRVNYFHTGNHGEEVIALDSVVSDGPWPGSRTRLIDTLNLGNYYFEVIDPEPNP